MWGRLGQVRGGDFVCFFALVSSSPSPNHTTVFFLFVIEANKAMFNCVFCLALLLVLCTHTSGGPWAVGCRVPLLPEVRLVESVGRLTEPALVPDPGYKPFMSVGWVSLTNDHTCRRSVDILRDTGYAVTDSRQHAALV